MRSLLFLFVCCVAIALVHAGCFPSKLAQLKSKKSLIAAGKVPSELRLTTTTTSTTTGAPEPTGHEDLEDEGTIELEPSNFALADDDRTYDDEHQYPNEDLMLVYAKHTRKDH